MASTAQFIASETQPISRDDRFFLWSAIMMTVVMVSGFSVQLAAGRSTFASPLIVHVHAFVFFGWVMIYLAQNVLATTGQVVVHRKLGWLAAGWVGALVVMGFVITIRAARNGTVAFFFQPQHFLIFNPLSVIFFAGLTAAAIVLRRRTDWHRRLHFCGMTLLLGPGFGRLLPMPLLAPYAFECTFAAAMLFPAAGVIADLRRDGQVHPAWRWGIGAIAAYFVLVPVLTHSAAGEAWYRLVTNGSRGATVAGLDFAAPPPGGLITGR
jgi:hypothetical protein